MPRRSVVALGVAITSVLGVITLPPASPGQPPPAGKVYRIGLLETTSLAQNAANVEALKQGLRERGYVEGRNFVIEYRSVDGWPDRFPGLAAEMVRMKMDVIMTRGTPAALAAKGATATIPIVMTGIGDPLGPGIVPSLARPGGNVTGLSGMVSELGGKRLELLKQAIPRIVRVGFVANGSNPAFASARKALEGSAQSLRLELLLLDVRKADDLAPAFEAAVRQGADAVDVALDSLTLANFRHIAALATKHRLPSIYPAPEFVEAGGLMAYGTNYSDLYRRAAIYVDKIFKGAKPGDLPIEQASTFELVINLKTARQLGVTLPQSLTVRADRVIQ